MSADSAVTYTSVHSEARSWSIPSEDPYEEAARQLLEQAPRTPEYVPDPIELEDHVPLHIAEHPEDLVPAEDEAYILEVASAPTPPLPPSFLSLRIRPLHTKAAMAQMRAVVPSTYHLLLPSGTPPLLPIPLHVPSTSRRAEIPEADTPPQKRLLLTAPRPGCEVGESSAAARQPGPTTAQMVNMRVSYQVDVRSKESLEFYSRHQDAQEDRAAVRAEIEREAMEEAHWGAFCRRNSMKLTERIRQRDDAIANIQFVGNHHNIQTVVAYLREIQLGDIRKLDWCKEMVVESNHRLCRKRWAGGSIFEDVVGCTSM
nr:hypothetical protein [Tanacetum cinerariifolium]